MQNGCLTFGSSDRQRSWKCAWKAARRTEWKSRENVADTLPIFFIAHTNIGAKGKNKNQGKYSQTRMCMWSKVSEKVPQLFWGVSSALCIHVYVLQYFDCFAVIKDKYFPPFSTTMLPLLLLLLGASVSVCVL